jgi:F-type H+-transporting ATPase subunit gamma
MANLITLKRRIGSIKNTRQITKAMELVSSSKLKRAQRQAQASRAYREAANALLARLSEVSEVEQHALFKKRAVKTRLYVVITSSTGLAGAYNANVLKLLTQSIKRDRADKVHSQVITIGNKGAQFARRLADVELVAAYPALGDAPTEQDIQPILNTVINNYKAEKVDEVHVLHTLYQSSITQIATDIPLLPAAQPTDGKPADGLMNFEPDVETVINETAARLFQAQIWQAALESLASEHAMRAIAMKNATDNANDLISDYTLEYNTARQAAITQELAEITGGAEALNA